MTKAPRPIRIEGDIAFIPLTKGYEAIIDAADVPLVSAWSWTTREKRRKDGSIKEVYAYRQVRIDGRPAGLSLHQQLLQPGPGFLTDHRDGDGLNNRRSNLRPANFGENARNCARPSHNTSGVKGVVWHSRDSRWQASIKLNGVRKTLGQFRCRTAAALAYAKASRQLHGEFGRLA